LEHGTRWIGKWCMDTERLIASTSRSLRLFRVAQQQPQLLFTPEYHELHDGGSEPGNRTRQTLKYGGGLKIRSNQHKQDATAAFGRVVARTPVTHSPGPKNALAVGSPSFRRNPSRQPVPSPFPSLSRGLLVPSAEPCWCLPPERVWGEERPPTAVRCNARLQTRRVTYIFVEPKNPTGQLNCLPAALAYLSAYLPLTKDPAFRPSAVLWSVPRPPLHSSLLLTIGLRSSQSERGGEPVPRDTAKVTEVRWKFFRGPSPSR